MAPDTKAANFKHIKDSIAAVSQDNNQKYELMANLLKGQNAKLDQTIENQGAQIRDIRSLIGTMAQQLEFALQRLSQPPSNPSQGTDKQALSMEGADSITKFFHVDRVPS